MENMRGNEMKIILLDRFDLLALESVLSPSAVNYEGEEFLSESVPSKETRLILGLALAQSENEGGPPVEVYLSERECWAFVERRNVFM